MSKHVCIILEPMHPRRKNFGEPWLFEVIEAHASTEFSLVLTASRDLGAMLSAEVPDNVTQVVWSGDIRDEIRRKQKKMSDRDLGPLIQELGRVVQVGDLQHNLLKGLFREVAKIAPAASFESVWRDPITWELLALACERSGIDLSFREYCQLLHDIGSSVWETFEVSEAVPAADIYHGIGGANAGLLAVGVGAARSVPTIYTDNRHVPAREYANYLQGKMETEARLRPHLDRRMRWAWRWRRMQYSFVADQVDTMVANSVAGAEEAYSLAGTGKEVHRIPVGAENEEVRRSRMIRRKHHPEQFTVGGYFEVIRESDVRMFLEAAAAVDRDMEGMHFLMWGPWSKEQEEEFKKMSKGISRVMDVVFSNIDAIETELSKADLVVIPSQSEAGDQILISCFDANMPVIAAGLDKYSALLESPGVVTPDQRYLLRVGIGDSWELEEAILNLLCNHRRFDAIGRNAHRHSATRFNEQTMIEEYGALYGLR